MINLGLDFGTTNSTLSYIDPDRNTLECYYMDASSTGYIPSFIRYDQTDQSVEIGASARSSQGDEDYDVLSGFKMLLAEKDTKRLEKHGFVKKTPDECAKDYIQNLIQTYCNDKQIKQGIHQLVITVPEIWVKEHRHACREHLKQICQDIHLPVKRFISEPVAASAYFVYRFFEKNKYWFTGHVLVCDYGGGTLDLSLTRVEGERILVLECTGKGHDDTYLGKAGLAFDQAALLRVYERETQKKLSRTHDKFLFLMEQFEKQKIERQSDIEKKLSLYLKNKTIDKKVFSVNDMSVMASDLVKTFDDIIRPDLEQALQAMKTFITAHGVDYSNSDAFRVIMVGGFSNFYLVQNTVKHFFHSETQSDKRFDSCFDRVETALAIAKGAALIANDRVNIDLTCPISVGIRVNAVHVDSTTGDLFITKQDNTILKKGTRLSEYHAPIFSDAIGVTIDPTKRDTRPVIFLGDDQNRWYIQLEKGLQELFPNVHEPDNKWQVGFSVNEDFLFELHAKELKTNGITKITPLGDLIERISGLIIHKEAA